MGPDPDGFDPRRRRNPWQQVDKDGEGFGIDCQTRGNATRNPLIATVMDLMAQYKRGSLGPLSSLSLEFVANTPQRLDQGLATPPSILLRKRLM